MDSAALWEAIAYAPTARLQEWADRCLIGADIETLSGPQRALMLVRAVESREGQPFNLGEVLVTSCEVSLDGRHGWGLVVGDEPVRALSAAVLDAADPERLRELEESIATEVDCVRGRWRNRWAALQRTRAVFEDLP